MMTAYHGLPEREELKSRQLITLCFANIILQQTLVDIDLLTLSINVSSRKTLQSKAQNETYLL
jgi:hypothetical protein